MHKLVLFLLCLGGCNLEHTREIENNSQNVTSNHPHEQAHEPSPFKEPDEPMPACVTHAPLETKLDVRASGVVLPFNFNTLRPGAAKASINQTVAANDCDMEVESCVITLESGIQYEVEGETIVQVSLKADLVGERQALPWGLKWEDSLTEVASKLCTGVGDAWILDRLTSTTQMLIGGQAYAIEGGTIPVHIAAFFVSGKFDTLTYKSVIE